MPSGSHQTTAARPPNLSEPPALCRHQKSKKPSHEDRAFLEFGGQSRNRTTDTRIFKTNYCQVSRRESPRNVTKFLSAERFRERNRTAYRTFVNYRSVAGVFVEQHQWDAPQFTDPLPIWRWSRDLLLLHSAMISLSGFRWLRQQKTVNGHSVFKGG